jgi:hypothetical protein
VRRLDRGSRGAYAAARVTGAWEKVCGEMVASHTAGVQLREGTLLVYVDGNSWAAHFEASSEEYRRAVNEELGEELVGQVRFSVSKSAAREARSGAPIGRSEEKGTEQHIDTVVPLSEIELDQIKASVDRIPDEGLREAVLRATVRDLEAKKGRASHNGSSAPPHGL